MPRVNNVYSPPAGTKAVPNTTIESAPYNTFVDDLTADANAPRPVIAGGTGASTIAGAQAALGVNDASNLTTGTLDDARLPERLGKVARTTTDWNAAIENGWWMGNGAANAPEPTGWFLGNVEAHGAAGYYTQTVHQFTGDGASDTKIWRRSTNGTSWEAWYRLRVSEAELDARYLQSGDPVNADTLDGQDGTYYLAFSNMTGTATAGQVPHLSGISGVSNLQTNDIVLGFSSGQKDFPFLRHSDGTVVTLLPQSKKAADSNLLDGQDGTYYRNLANATGSLPATQVPFLGSMRGADQLATAAGSTIGFASGDKNVPYFRHADNSIIPLAPASSVYIKNAADLVYQGSNHDNTVFPIGETVLALGTGINNSQASAVWSRTNGGGYSLSSDAFQLAGTWRGRGATTGSTLMVRTA